MEMEIQISRQTLKKTFGVLLVIALFFGICSPAAPYLPKIAFNASAVGEVVTSGNCGHVTQGNATYKLYDDGTLVITGSGKIEGELISRADGIYRSPFEAIENDVTNIVIDDGITHLGEYVFRNLKNLKSIEIPNSVVEIGRCVFYDCTSLKSIKLPDSVTEIYGSAFANSTGLENIKLPDNLTRLPYHCFYGCTNLKSIEIPDSVTEIGNGAFESCTSLESVKLPDNLTRLPYRCFYGCTNLKSIEIPDSVVELGEFDDMLGGYAGEIFGNCASLESVKLPKEIKVIPECCFVNCTSLKSIELPDGVTKIGVCVFENCINLETVKFNEGLEIIEESAFRSCYLLKAADLPSTVKTIGRSAFQDCIYLEEVTIPESVTSVGEGLFTNCIRLSKVNIMNPDCEILYDRDTLPETAVIYGYSDSTAEKYATDWLRKFVPFDKEHDHEFESKVTLKPTCTSTGVETFTCYCGENYTEVIVPNSHFDFTSDGNCDACGTKLNAGGSNVTPDEGEGDNTTEAPDEGGTTTPPAEDDTAPEAPDNNDEPVVEEPEVEKGVFASFFESIINFFKNLMNIFNIFKK